ncbi:hypothetical protein IAR50_007603 [Cryptococcus sp. DSM 104548]
MSLSPAQTIASLHEIVTCIVASTSSPADLAALMQTSTLFFHLAAPRLYRSIPISHTCNPLVGASATVPDQGELLAKPFGKDALLTFVEIVRLERCDIWQTKEESPAGSNLDGTRHVFKRKKAWYDSLQPYPLPNIRTVDIQPHPTTVDHPDSSPNTTPSHHQLSYISHPSFSIVCEKATHLHLSTQDVHTYGHDEENLPFLPLPRVRAVTIKARMSQIETLITMTSRLGIAFDASHKPTLELNVYVWDDVCLVDNSLPTMGSRGEEGKETRLDWQFLKDLGSHTCRHLQTPDFKSILNSLVAYLSIQTSFHIIRFFNLPSILERYAENLGENVASIERMLLENFGQVRDLQAQLYGWKEEESVKMVFQGGEEYYDRYWNGQWLTEYVPPTMMASEEVYYRLMVNPSPSLVGLRTRMAKHADAPVSWLSSLHRDELERLLEEYDASSRNVDSLEMPSTSEAAQAVNIVDVVTPSSPVSIQVATLPSSSALPQPSSKRQAPSCTDEPPSPTCVALFKVLLAALEYDLDSPADYGPYDKDVLLWHEKIYNLHQIVRRYTVEVERMSEGAAGAGDALTE